MKLVLHSLLSEFLRYLIKHLLLYGCLSHNKEILSLRSLLPNLPGSLIPAVCNENRAFFPAPSGDSLYLRMLLIPGNQHRKFCFVYQPVNLIHKWAGSVNKTYPPFLGFQVYPSWLSVRSDNHRIPCLCLRQTSDNLNSPFLKVSHNRVIMYKVTQGKDSASAPFCCLCSFSLCRIDGPSDTEAKAGILGNYDFVLMSFHCRFSSIPQDIF